MTTTVEPSTATIAIVTYNRSGLLSRLLQSIVEMDPKPGHVVIVDNASVDDTTEVVESFRPRVGTEIVYRRLDENTGGSGGFSEGMRVAYDLGSEWVWLMDDDVEVVPDGLARMLKWAPRFKSRVAATTTTAASSTGSTACPSPSASRSRSHPRASTTPDSGR
jgi:rhamnopyranosyl-N-acetylglucosaminyl-diphospho-decaprenol beta-1,3/1,4-galactofuranosyltransferase